MHKTLLAGAAVAALSFASAQAAPVALALSNFTGSDTVVDFNAATRPNPVGALYAASGVTFSDTLIGLDNFGDRALFPNNGGGMIASNWDYAANRGRGLSFTASFSSMYSRVGFYLEDVPNQTTTIELFRGDTSLGALNLVATDHLAAAFRGVGETTGFNRMVFTTTNEFNGFYAIDDLIYGGSGSGVGSGAVPEPATWALMISGFGLAGAALRRRRTVTL